MKRILAILTVIYIQSICMAQQGSETIKANGFLFLTNYNYQYDFHGESETKPLGFHDFFFPVENFDSNCIADTNKAVIFKNGLRVDYIQNRNSLKNKAMLFKGADTSLCYPQPQFYIIPVTISYLQYEDYEPFICRHNYFDIKVTNGSALHFEYEHQMIKPTKIMPIIKKKKRQINRKE